MLLKKFLTFLLCAVVAMSGLAQAPDSTKPYTKLNNYIDYGKGIIFSGSMVPPQDTFKLRASDVGALAVIQQVPYIWTKSPEGLLYWKSIFVGAGTGITSIGFSSASLDFTPNPLTANGTVTANLKVSGATAGSYVYPSININEYGIITSITSGVIPVPQTRTITINGQSYDLSADRNWVIPTGIPSSRMLTINGVSYDLSADRSWVIPTGVPGAIYDSLNAHNDRIKQLDAQRKIMQDTLLAHRDSITALREGGKFVGDDGQVQFNDGSGSKGVLSPSALVVKVDKANKNTVISRPLDGNETPVLTIRNGSYTATNATAFAVNDWPYGGSGNATWAFRNIARFSSDRGNGLSVRFNNNNSAGYGLYIDQFSLKAIPDAETRAALYIQTRASAVSDTAMTIIHRHPTSLAGTGVTTMANFQRSIPSATPGPSYGASIDFSYLKASETSATTVFRLGWNGTRNGLLDAAGSPLLTADANNAYHKTDTIPTRAWVRSYVGAGGGSPVSVPADQLLFGTGAGYSSSANLKYSAGRLFLKAVDASASSYSLDIQRFADATPLLRLDNTGNLKFGSGATSTLAAGTLGFSSGSVQIFSALAGTAQGRGLNFMTNNNLSATANYVSIASFGTGIQPTTGNARFSMIDFNPTYNQTGTSSGNLDALWYSPTETSIKGEHNFINSLSPTARIKMAYWASINRELDTNALKLAVIDGGGVLHKTNWPKLLPTGTVGDLLWHNGTNWVAGKTIAVKDLYLTGGNNNTFSAGQDDGAGNYSESYNTLSSGIATAGQQAISNSSNVASMQMTATNDSSWIDISGHKIQLSGRLSYRMLSEVNAAVPDADISATPLRGSFIVLPTPASGATRTLTIPNATRVKEVINIHNAATSGKWLVSGTVKDLLGNNITEFKNQANYSLYWNGAAWICYTGGTQSVGLNRPTGNLINADSVGIVVDGVASTDKAFVPLPLRRANTAYVGITNTTTATTLFSGSGVGSTTLPNLRAGDVLLIKVNGIYSTTTGTNTLAIGVGLGGVSTSHTMNFAASQTNKPFEIELEFTPYSNGTSGTIVHSMRSWFLDGSFATQNSRWVTSFTGFNNSSTVPVTLTGTWNVANAANSVTIYSVTMEVKKGNW